MTAVGTEVGSSSVDADGGTVGTEVGSSMLVVGGVAVVVGKGVELGVVVLLSASTHMIVPLGFSVAEIHVQGYVRLFFVVSFFLCGQSADAQ